MSIMLFHPGSCKELCGSFFWSFLLAAFFFVACSEYAFAQVITGWEEEQLSLPGSSANGIVCDLDDGKVQEQFLDWGTTLANFGSVETVTQEQLEERMQNDADIVRSDNDVILDGRKINIPCFVNEDGVDLYLLSEEGIAIYMALLSPVYYQEPDSDVVRWIRFYGWDNRKRTKALFGRYVRWEAFVREMFCRSGVPEEMAEICLVESGCTVDALSPAGARGMWQLMPATARQYGMTVNESVDERLDPVRSTSVAAKVLMDDYLLTHDWTLAVAAYNCGARRLQPSRTGTLLWSEVCSSLPEETRQYVPSLLALHYVWKYRNKLGFQ